MKTWVKVTLSVGGVFLAGLTTAYQAHPEGPALAWIMAGLAAVASYLVGYYQLNPALRRRSPPLRKKARAIMIERVDLPNH